MHFAACMTKEKCLCCSLNFSNQFGFYYAFVSDYDDNEFETIKNKSQTGLKNFKPRSKLNHNLHVSTYTVATCTCTCIKIPHRQYNWDYFTYIHPVIINNLIRGLLNGDYGH